MDWSRRLKVRLAAAGAAFLGMAQAPAPQDVAALAGGWDLTLEGSTRKCRVTLGTEPGGVGHILRFPAGCRRALPFLNTIGGWDAPAPASLRFIDAAGEPGLEFKKDGEAFVARTAKGETYRLDRQEHVEQTALALPPIPPAIGVPQVTPIDPAKAPPFASVPGTYFVDRYTEREVCRIALSATRVEADGRYRASVLEGCRDAGIQTFQPAAWRYEAGRLILTSRRGHEVTLISEREGQWRRDPEVGATLILRRAPP